MILEFKIKEHYGRKDFYPVNDAAILALKLKTKIKGIESKCFKNTELQILEAMGHEIKIVQEFANYKSEIKES